MRPTFGLMFSLLAVASATAEPLKPPTPEQLLTAERQFVACGIHLSGTVPIPFFYVGSNPLSADALAKLPDPPFRFGVSFQHAPTAAECAAFKKRTNLVALALSSLPRDDVKLLAELREWTTVTDLRLNSPQLNAGNLKQLADLKHLRALTISNPLDDQTGIWKQAQALPDLERLALAGVREEAVGAFAGCKKLRALTLVQLSNVVAEELAWPRLVAAFTDLEELRIGSMGVSNAVVEQLKPLTKLKQLRIAPDVSSDEIRNTDNNQTDERLAAYHKAGLLHAHPRFFAANGTRPASLADVTAVNMSKTDLAAAGLKLVALCPNLTTLDLAETRTASGKLSALAGLNKLREVDLSRHAVPDGDLKALKASKGLRTLTMQNFSDQSLRILREQNQLHALSTATATDGGRPATAADVIAIDLRTGSIEVRPPSDAGMKELADLSNLKSLRAGDLTGKGIEALARLPKLEALHFTPLDDAALAALSELPALRELSLGEYSPVTAKGWASIGRLVKLRTLSLHGVSVRPEDLKSLRGLAALHTLRLSNEQLSHSQLKVLVEIGLGHTPLQVTGSDGRRPINAEGVTGVVLKAANRELPADGFKPLLAFPNLADLDISNCTGAVDEALKDLHELKHLRRLSVVCRGIEAHTADAAAVRKLAEAVKLESLTIAGHLLFDDREGRLVGELAGIAGLRELRLHAVRVGDAGLATIAAMPGLRSLEVRDDGFTKQGLTVLAKCKTLRHLRLGVRFECDVAFKAWKELPELETLELATAPVGSTAWRALAEYPALARLGIATPAEVDDGLPVLAKLKTLRALKLSAPAFRDNGNLAQSLCPLKQLAELDVTGCGVTFGQYTKLVESLQFDLPKCRLVGR